MNKKLPESKRDRERKKTQKQFRGISTRIEKLGGVPPSEIQTTPVQKSDGGYPDFRPPPSKNQTPKCIDTNVENECSDFNVADATTLPRKRRRVNPVKPGETTERVIALTQERNRAGLKRKTKRPDAATNKEAIKAQWKLTFEEVTGDSYAGDIRGDDIGKFLKITKGNPIKDLESYFTNVCKLWYKIRTGPLAWIENMPGEPSFMFVASFARYLQAAIYEVKKSKKRGSLETVIEERKELSGMASIVHRGINEPVSSRNGDIWVTPDGSILMYDGNDWCNYAGVEVLRYRPDPLTSEDIEAGTRRMREIRNGGSPMEQNEVDTEGKDPEMWK